MTEKETIEQQIKRLGEEFRKVGEELHKVTLSEIKFENGSKIVKVPSKELIKGLDQMTEIPNDKINPPTPVILEQKDSVGIEKNTKGFNWKIKIYAKEGVDMFAQIDETKQQIIKRIKVWEMEK